MSTSELALNIENVVKNYGTLQALGGVSLSVRPGEIFGLLGPNGAGKTSLISILVTLEQATSGRVRIFGHDVQTHPKLAKMRTGWVPQEIIHHGFFTLEEILSFHAGYYGVRQPKERIDFLLQKLGLWDHRKKKVKQLSGGMKRRLMIAKALVHNPGILLLDEPTAGVDVELRTSLWHFVEELKKEGISILPTTHYLEEAERLCDRVAIIQRGHIRAVDQTRNLIEQYSRKRTHVFLTEPVSMISHPDVVSGSGEQWTFQTAMGKPLGELLRELKIPMERIRDVKIDEGSLEDVFIKVTTTAEGEKP